MGVGEGVRVGVTVTVGSGLSVEVGLGVRVDGRVMRAVTGKIIAGGNGDAGIASFEISVIRDSGIGVGSSAADMICLEFDWQPLSSTNDKPNKTHATLIS